MTSAAFPMINLATIHAIMRGVVRAGIFPSTSPQRQGAHTPTPSHAIYTPSLYHTAMQPNLEDNNLFNTIIDLQILPTPLNRVLLQQTTRALR